MLNRFNFKLNKIDFKNNIKNEGIKSNNKMASKSLVKKIKADISKLSVNLSVESIDNLIFQDEKLTHLINIENYLSILIEEKIKHISLFGDKLNLLKKNINILKRNIDENIENLMYSYEILLDIMITKAEQLSILQEKKELISSMINIKDNNDLNSSLEIIVLTH